MTDLFEPSTIQRQAPPSSRGRSAASKRAARKRKKRRQQRTAIILVLLLGGLGVGGYLLVDRLGSSMAGFAWPWETQAEDYAGPGADPVQVEIPAGATGSVMGQALLDAGVVASVGAFNEAFETTPGATGIQPGTYELLTQMKASEAVQQLVANEKIQTNVTIPEGYTVVQIVDKITSVTEFSREDVEKALDDPKVIGLPKQAGGNPEGWLFPKTYSVQPGDTAVDLLSTMVDQTTAELEALGVPKDEWEDTLIKASLVEREAKHDEDRPKMARAIENRLEIGQALQIDATTAYGAQKSGMDLTHADNQDPDNEYSTYAHTGLPPGPIASPGAASIGAVVNPADGPWKFWCTVNLETGETKFSETYEEHQIYEAEMHRWMDENGY